MESKECNTCKTTYNVCNFGTYKDRKGKDTLRSECKGCRSKKESERNKNNANRPLYCKNWRERNKEYIKDYERSRVSEQRKTNQQYKIKSNICSSLRHFLKGERKTLHSIGCSFEQLKIWITYNFDSTMTWEQMSWQVDHVIPLSFFDLTNTYEYKIACHWTNIRPLSRTKNQLKCDKIHDDDIKKHAYNVTQFLSIHNSYQVGVETCLWQTVEVWYGKNAQDEESINDFLKRTIRSQAPNPDMTRVKHQKTIH